MKLFLKGFNHGYTLSKELPDKWAIYSNIGDHGTEYGVGFKKGSELGQRIRLEKRRGKSNDGPSLDHLE